MTKRKLMVAGMMMLSLVAVAAGCGKKNETAAAKPPAHEKIAVVKFASVPPLENLPNVQASPGGAGQVEWVNDQSAGPKNTVSAKKPLTLAGWTANPIDGSVPPTILVQLNGPGGVCFYAPATRTKLKRPDIAKMLKAPAFENSSFQLDGDLSAVKPGDYMVSFLLADKSKNYIIGFDTGQHLIVQ